MEDDYIPTQVGEEAKTEEKVRNVFEGRFSRNIKHRASYADNCLTEF